MNPWPRSAFCHRLQGGIYTHGRHTSMSRPTFQNMFSHFPESCFSPSLSLYIRKIKRPTVNTTADIWFSSCSSALCLHLTDPCSHPPSPYNRCIFQALPGFCLFKCHYFSFLSGPSLKTGIHRFMNTGISYSSFPFSVNPTDFQNRTESSFSLFIS